MGSKLVLGFLPTTDFGLIPKRCGYMFTDHYSNHKRGNLSRRNRNKPWNMTEQKCNTNDSHSARKIYHSRLGHKEHCSHFSMMFLTSAWIERFGTRCFLCDWFKVTWSRTASSMAMGSEQGKGGGDLFMQHSESKWDSSISHTRRTEPSKRTIIWPVYELTSRNMVT